MNKIVLGILVGGILGIFDGLTAWFTPEVRAGIIGIVIGSTFKGMIAGLIAGWFARRVNNTAAGIAVGLAAGALLAYGVVAMQNNKYFWEIMLPGSLVGAIVGWATQRYGRAARPRSAATSALVGLLLLTAMTVQGVETSTAQKALDRLKSLSGTWKGHVMTTDGPPITVEYRTTAGGTVVEERLFAGDPHEMVTMYSIDEGALMATHYCSMGNQPTMKLNPARSTSDKLVFDFVSLRGKGDSIHDGWIELTSADTLLATWRGSVHGKEGGDAKKFYLTRVK